MKRFQPALILLITAILAYGLLIPQLGFYWDDLPMSWVRYQLGPQAMAQYFSTNRPIWGWLYQVTTRLLPHVPVYWQVFALFWRWLGALVLWAIVRKLWRDRQLTALSVSLFFLLYPGFNQQWGSFLYSHFFIVIFFFLCSLYLMLHGGWANKALAMLLAALNLWMLEYFFVLELGRPFLIWISLHGETLSTRQRLRRTLGLWLPYLAVFILAVLSRLFIFNNQIYGFGIKEQFAEKPLIAAVSLLQDVFTSLWTATMAAWAQVFQVPNPTVDGLRTTVLYGAVAVIAFGAILFSFWRRQTEGHERDGHDAWRLIVLGFVMLLLGGPPFWLTGVPVSLGFPANRALLSFMLGASLILAGFIELIPSVRWRYVLIAVLVALAAGRQFLWANDFRRAWTAHKNFFWQMTWRAPGLEPNTMVLTNEELDFYADNSMGAALNWIYAADNHSEHVDYVLFYPANRIGGSLPALDPDVPVHYSYLAGEFEGNTSQAAAFYYHPPGCVRLLDPEIDPYNRLIPDDSLLREAAALSTATPILNDATARMPEAYGSEPVHGWCYYFEQADLARQLNDWKRVAALGDSAFGLDDYPNDPIERFVFIEGYAHTGEWEKAKELSLVSYRVSKDYVGPLLCRLWQRIDRNAPESDEKTEFVIQVKTLFLCNP